MGERSNFPPSREAVAHDSLAKQEAALRLTAGRRFVILSGARKQAVGEALADGEPTVEISRRVSPTTAGGAARAATAAFFGFSHGFVCIAGWDRVDRLPHALLGL